MTNDIKAITVHELKKMMDEKNDFQLIDCREPHEYEFCNIGGDLIPMGHIVKNIEKISRDKTVIVHCHVGGRSARIVSVLQSKYGFTNLFNLDGGIRAWSEEIDPSIPQY
jgi:rhodanese-related sulfurtransferase